MNEINLSLPEALELANQELEKGNLENCQQLLLKIFNFAPDNVEGLLIKAKLEKKRRGFQFSNLWFYHSSEWYWPSLFTRLSWNKNQPKTIIEIGSFEGQSTCYILENLINNSESKVYCVDTFSGGIEHDQESTINLFDKFQHNINITGKADLVTVLRGYSCEELPKLIVQGIKADFIYIDGSHMAKEVLIDATMSWVLLKSGGLMIFDDYHWPMYKENPLYHPKMAIDAFVNCFFADLEFVLTHQSYQYCLLKK